MTKPSTARTIPPAMNKVVLYGMVNIIIGKLSSSPAGAADVFDIEINEFALAWNQARKLILSE
jgi:hypothetical protein